MIMASGATVAAAMRSDNMKKTYDGLPLERITFDPRDNVEMLKTSYGGYSITVHYIGYIPAFHGCASTAIVRKDEDVWHISHLNNGKLTRRQVAEWLIDYVRLMIERSNVDEFHLVRGYPRLEPGQVTKDSMVDKKSEARHEAKPAIEIKELEDYKK